MQKKRKQVKHNECIAYIKTTRNNIIITLTDNFGNTLCWASSGTSGFKSVEKGTEFAAQVVAEDIISKAQGLGIKNIKVILSGSGVGREPALEVFVNSFDVVEIKDLIKMPYNGCRPPKRRKP